MVQNNIAVGILFLFSVFPHRLITHEDIPGLLTEKKVSQNISFGIDTTLHSKVLEEDRHLVIRLPKTYTESTHTTYPVLYILDAEGGRGWSNALSTVDELNTIETIPEMILVGIHNTNRNRDMIPQEVAHRPGSGGSDKFLQFITDELNPFIESRYRITGFTLLYGGSNAGLFTVYALLAPQDVIQAGIAASPMIGHCSDFMFNHVDKLLRSNRISERTLFMIYGENDSKRVVDYTPKFLDLIKSKAPGSIRSKIVILENEGHVPPTSLRLGLVEIFKQ